jgi:hypothetical protein
VDRNICGVGGELLTHCLKRGTTFGEGKRLGGKQRRRLIRKKILYKLTICDGSPIKRPFSFRIHIFLLCSEERGMDRGEARGGGR